MIIPPQLLGRLLGYPEEKLDCSGLKLTLGEVHVASTQGVLKTREREIPRYSSLAPRNNIYYLKPGFYIIRYNEYVKIPPNAIALAIPRSSLLRMGATLFTAVWDPGYEGRGYGLLLVGNPHGISLEKNVQVAQLIFIEMKGASQKLYKGAYYKEK